MEITTILSLALNVILSAFLFGLIQWRKKAEQGQALIRTGGNDIRVSFNYIWINPIIHKLEVMDISLKTFTLERKGKEGVICKDCLRVDIKMTFWICINQTEMDVKNVAQSIGTQRASNIEIIRQLFEAKFIDALKATAKEFNFEEIHQDVDKFKYELLMRIGEEFNSYVLESLSIDYLEQTPIGFLDPNNILDAQAIKKIKEQQEKI